MGKISKKKKKKGRPPKADLSTPVKIKRNKVPDPPPESDLRRSIRRRNLRYTDEFYDDDDDNDDDDERRKEKKMKLVLRLATGQGRVDSGTIRNEVNATAPDSTVSGSSSEYGDDSKPFKKRRINAADERDGNGYDDDEVRSVGSDDQKKEIEQNKDSKGLESVQGLEGIYLSGIPLPDKKQLELILDKLQKKDTYGVYAEPVDPEELPDYHDIIENPMDFCTIRKKLEKGAYTKLEELEADVYLLCSNAMQYNTPDTIYFKQARSIQEQARKKFHRLRVECQRSEAEIKTKQKTRSNIVVKKSIKKSACRVIQESVGSDFSSGATRATMAETGNWSNTTQATVGCERPTNFYGLVDRNSSLPENKSEKAEEQLSGKGFPSKFGKKPFVLDDNHRATYGIISQDLVKDDSMFSIFEGHNKQLVAVGLHKDHSYARSLARFAATLGPVAWKVASQRIEQALPVGFRFGHGWVGEYEPLPTSVLVLEHPTPKEHFKNPLKTVNSRIDDQSVEESLKAKQDDVQLGLGAGVSSTSHLQGSTRETHLSGTISRRMNPGSTGVAGPKPLFNDVGKQQNPLVTNFARYKNNVLKQDEISSYSSVGEDTTNVASREQPVKNSHMTISRSLKIDSRNRNLAYSAPFKHPDIDEAVAGELPNEKSVGSSLGNHRVSSFTSDLAPNKQVRLSTSFPHGNHDQGLSDPVQMLRMMAEKTQNQQKYSTHPMIDAPKSRIDNSIPVATTPAQPWMTLGVAQAKTTDSLSLPKMQIASSSLYTPAGENQSGSQVHDEPPVSRGSQLQPNKNMFPPQGSLQQNVHIGENIPVFLPQLRMTDLSRFQVQSLWGGVIPRTQTSNKQDALPPDLNIGFRSSGSPIRQSSGVLVDSQQPDLALQL